MQYNKLILLIYFPRHLHIFKEREIFLCRKYLYRAGVLVSLKIQPPFFNMDEYLPQKRFFSEGPNNEENFL